MRFAARERVQYLLSVFIYRIATGREVTEVGAIMVGTATYQNQILNQVGQTTVREHKQTGYWSGNTLGITIALAQLVVVAVFGRVGLFVTLLGTGATRNELQEDYQSRLVYHGRGKE